MTVHSFNGRREMLSIANKPDLQADEQPVFRENHAGRAVEVEDWKAIYNPHSDTVFSVVTDDYEIINPGAFIGPLAAELGRRDRDDVHGEIHVRDGGAKAYGELLFDNNSIWPPDRSRSENPVRVGVNVWWSHDSGLSVRASGFAQDGVCANTMRRVTDTVKIKHAGDVGERVDFMEEWSTILNQLGTFQESLAEIVAEAFEYTLFDLGSGSAFPSDWIEVIDPPKYAFDPDNTRSLVPAPGPLTERDLRGFYSFYWNLGLPSYLSVAATDRLVLRQMDTDDPTTVSAWDAYSAGTYALTHESRADPGTSADDSHHRALNDVLVNPELSIRNANLRVQSRIAPDEDQATVEETVTEETVGEALTQFEERERQLRASLGGD